MDFETGTQYLYNNSGYNLLAYIIESVSAKPYMDFMKERIFRPLGMNKTGGRDPQFVVLNRAVGYEWRIDRLTGRDGNLTDLMGAGSIISTVSDMAKWAMALRNDTLLKPASKAEMWKQNVFNDGKTFPYGLAFRISDIRGHKMIGHTGQTAGFGAAVFRYVNDDVSVVVLTNLGELGLGGQIAAGIAKIYIPSMSLREMKVALAAPDEKISANISAAIRQRIENKPSPEIFSAGLIRALSTERSKAANSKIAAYGDVREILFGGQETIDGKVNFRYLAKTDKRLFLWRFVLDTDRKIADMTLEEEE
jgi:CubicO group peptidase (beta-lactamase class C family)